MPHFLDLSQAGAAACRAIIDDGLARKRARYNGSTPWPKGRTDADAPLAGHVLASVFEKPSTRTRVSFEMAMRQLGGETITLSHNDLQLGRGETIEDTARVLSGYVDAIMLRTNGHDSLLALADAASVPVINGLTDASHPCQILADIMAFEEHVGPVAGTCWAWLGDGNNVANSLIEAAGLLGFHIQLGVAPGYAPSPAVVERARALGSRITLTEDAQAAVKGAQAVVTDTWVSMGQDGGAAKLAAMAPYQVNAALMAKAAPDAVFLHCLPAHRGEEVTGDVIDGPASLIWTEAENRLHAQKSVLLWCLGKL